MRKFIMLVFIIGFIGSANAAEVTYHFTAEIYSYTDDAEILKDMGYSADMPLKGTITIDPEAELLKFYRDTNEAYAFNWWNTGVITFEDQGYFWIDDIGHDLFIQNYSTEHEIKIMTQQGDLTVNPDEPEIIQMVILTIDGLDASMPSDLDLGNSPQYIVEVTKAGGLVSSFNANIIEIMNAEEYANSTTQSTEQMAKTASKAKGLVDARCSCTGKDWKNHGAYVRCVTKVAKELTKEGLITKQEKRGIVSEAANSECGKKMKEKKEKKKK